MNDWDKNYNFGIPPAALIIALIVIVVVAVKAKLGGP